MPPADPGEHSHLPLPQEPTAGSGDSQERAGPASQEGGGEGLHLAASSGRATGGPTQGRRGATRHCLLYTSPSPRD
eukprot:11517740-Alexandrium_andersonii.AAC.3